MQCPNSKSSTTHGWCFSIACLSSPLTSRDLEICTLEHASCCRRALSYYCDMTLSQEFSQWECSFHWKLCWHWLEFLRQCQIAVVRQGPDPSRHGWLQKNNSLVPVMLPEDVSPVSLDVLQMVKCGCASTYPCLSGRCDRPYVMLYDLCQPCWTSLGLQQ